MYGVNVRGLVTMPITQERLLALVTEAESILSIHRNLVGRLNRLITVGRTNGLSGGDVTELLEAEITATPYIVTEAIRDERKHYNSTAHRNEKSRRIMERKRRAAGVPVRESFQYRANAMARQRSRDEEIAYQEWMKGDAITADDVRSAEARLVAQQVTTTYNPRTEARIAQLETAGKEIAQRAEDADIVPPESLVPLRIDDSSANPTQWSPERLAAEATRGAVNLDEEL